MSKKKIENLSYQEAMAQLEEIVNELQQEGVGLDILSEKIKVAKRLIAHCSNKLRSTEEELLAILDEEE